MSSNPLLTHTSALVTCFLNAPYNRFGIAGSDRIEEA